MKERVNVGDIYLYIPIKHPTIYVGYVINRRTSKNMTLPTMIEIIWHMIQKEDHVSTWLNERDNFSETSLLNREGVETDLPIYIGDSICM